MNLLSGKWPFYISGTALAVLMTGSLYLFNDPIGLGDTLRMMGEYGADAGGGAVSSPPPLDWQSGFLFGLFFGGLAAALMSANFRFKLLADCGRGFTEKVLKTVGGGIVGGFLVMLGIQLAGDSVYGQFAAAMQLSAAAWVYLGALLVTAATLALLLDRRGDVISEEEDK